jgi:hypothetical protein
VQLPDGLEVLVDEACIRIAQLGGLLGDFVQDLPQVEG